MNGLPLHPAIVHVPLGLAVVVPLLALGLAIAIRKGALPRRSWVVVVAVQTILVAGGLFALRTGEQDEERIEDRVAEQAIDRHEALGERFVWRAGGTLVLSVTVLLLRSNPATAPLMAATTLASLLTAGIGLEVGHTGGALVHGGTSTGAMSDGRPGAGADDDD